MGSSGNIRESVTEVGCITILYVLLFLNLRHTVPPPAAVEKKCVKLHILSNVKHTDVIRTLSLLSFLPFLWSLSPSSSLLTHSHHIFSVKETLTHLGSVSGASENKSGNNDTKCPRKMAKEVSFPT